MAWNELTAVICISIAVSCFVGSYIGQKWDGIVDYIKWIMEK